MRSHSFVRWPATPTSKTQRGLWMNRSCHSKINPTSGTISRLEVESPTCLARTAVPSQIHLKSFINECIRVFMYVCMGVNIYIYIYFKKKQRNRSHRIINLFPSCYAFLKFPKTRKKLTGPKRSEEVLLIFFRVFVKWCYNDVTYVKWCYKTTLLTEHLYSLNKNYFLVLKRFQLSFI